MLMSLHGVVICLLIGALSAKAVAGNDNPIQESRLSVFTAVDETAENKEVEGALRQESQPINEENCWVAASQRYGVDAWLLYSIAQQESSLNPRALNRNKDGTFDIGIMQINSSHLTTLAGFGIRAEHLWEPCLNIQVGAWILADSIRQFGPNWNAVGGYNVGTKRSKHKETLRERYARRVYLRYQRNLRLQQQSQASN
jgi:soluble lytic murein transglycosylase-like protein